MEKIFEIKSPFKITVKLDDSGLEIQRKGFLVASGQKGAKRMFYKNISSVQLKEGTMLSNGFLQFTFSGSSERSGMFGIMGLANDENTIIFSKKDNSMMQELKSLVEKKQPPEKRWSPDHTQMHGGKTCRMTSPVIRA